MKSLNLKKLSAAALLSTGIYTMPVTAAVDIVKIDGSSTVYPITEAVAEEFQKETGIKVTVGVSGTGGGFKNFVEVKQLYQMLQDQLRQKKLRSVKMLAFHLSKYL